MRAKERPIPFSGPMIRAILEGRKTQTRRVVQLWRDHPLPDDAREWNIHLSAEGFGSLYRPSPGGGETCWPLPRCPYPPGSTLWVREAFRVEAGFNDLPPREVPGGEHVWYEATDEWRYSSAGKLRPGMFMPRWASRLTLEVTAVRVERLQETREDDVVAEGVTADPKRPWLGACDLFSYLWDEINGKRAPWASNPWAWVVEFKRAEAAMEAA